MGQVWHISIDMKNVPERNWTALCGRLKVSALTTGNGATCKRCRRLHKERLSLIHKEPVDPVFTNWVREWWPRAKVYRVRKGRKPDRWYITNVSNNTFRTEKLADGNRMAARLNLHHRINYALEEREIGPEAAKKRDRS